MKKLFITILTLVLLQSCAGGINLSTPYKPLGTGLAGGGYSDQQIAHDRFKVIFFGNGFTGCVTTKNKAMLRVAELSKEVGKEIFVIVDEYEESDGDGGCKTELEFFVENFSEYGGLNKFIDWRKQKAASNYYIVEETLKYFEKYRSN
tara:strand:+ start:403 stop:846 length:444 start_codon:yes stop_codon:yes gene_type:complete